METERSFKNQSEQEHYEILMTSMHYGLVFTENEIKVDARKDIIAHMTSIFLREGIVPKFTTGGEIAEAATEDFFDKYRDRILALVKKKEEKSKKMWWKIKTGRRYSRQSN